MSPRPAIRAIGPAAAAVLAVLPLAGCGSSSADSQVAVDYYQPGHQQTVGDVSGPGLEGGRLSLASLRGHVVVVDFWASNCSPCRAEQQTLNEVAGAQRDNGVRFLGIDVRDIAANARAFLRDHPASYPSISDPNGMLTLQFHGAEPQTTPTTIVLTAQGRIAARINGSSLYTQLMGVVNKVRSWS